MDTPPSTDSFGCDDVQFVSSSSQPRAEIDIIIIDDHSGTGSHTLTESKSLHDRLWHLYPEALETSRSRILVFDYCAAASPSWNGLEEGRRTVSEQAQLLLDLILKQRNTWRTMYRPIIFITHGLGGMLAEEALRLSIESGYKKSIMIRREAIIANSTYGSFLLSNKPSLGWKPYDWDRVTAKQLKPIIGSGMDVESRNALSESRCLHHERCKLPPFLEYTRRTSIFFWLFAQALFIVSAMNQVKTLRSLDLVITVAFYVLYVFISYLSHFRDRYQKHIVALGLLVGSIPSIYLFVNGATFDVIVAILAACVTLSIGGSAFVHWFFPDRLANEEWKVFRVIKEWAEDFNLRKEDLN